tara:strand:- start:3 stop:191 length:189 start_codon:yes stop_codon:yes gene_type:complete
LGVGLRKESSESLDSVGLEVEEEGVDVVGRRGVEVNAVGRLVAAVVSLEKHPSNFKVVKCVL